MRRPVRVVVAASLQLIVGAGCAAHGGRSERARVDAAARRNVTSYLLGAQLDDVSAAVRAVGPDGARALAASINAGPGT